MRLPIAVLVALSALAAAKPRPWERFEPLPAMPKPATAGFVDVDGAKIYYAMFGTGAPVILLHGGMGNSDQWSHQVPALAEKLQVIVIDSRGQGRSTRTKVKPTYDLLAGDVLAVMDYLELKQAAVVGWSDGGEIGLKLAIHHPDRITKLFVYGANYDENGTKPRARKSHPTFDAYNARCRADYKRLSKTPKQYNAIQQWLLPIWRDPMGFTQKQLQSIKVPTIVSGGDHDEIIAMAQVEEMAKLIPNGRLVVFKDTSHFAHWQDPAGFNRVLVEFLTAR
jgi:pimeloyl-ACP methyl ester carboxylesterase